MKQLKSVNNKSCSPYLILPSKNIFLANSADNLCTLKNYFENEKLGFLIILFRVLARYMRTSKSPFLNSDQSCT